MGEREDWVPSSLTLGPFHDQGSGRGAYQERVHFDRTERDSCNDPGRRLVAGVQAVCQANDLRLDHVLSPLLWRAGHFLFCRGHVFILLLLLPLPCILTNPLVPITRQHLEWSFLCNHGWHLSFALLALEVPHPVRY